MKKISLVLLTIFLILFTDVNGQGNESGEETEEKYNPDDYHKPLRIPDSGKEGDYTAGGLNTKDPNGTRFHINVIEGFNLTDYQYSFNMFGKKYFKEIGLVLAMVISYKDKLRNRIRRRNLKTNKIECLQKDSLLTEKMNSLDSSYSKDEAQSILEGTRNAVVSCGRGEEVEKIDIDWNDLENITFFDEALKNHDISENTGNNYLEVLSKVHVSRISHLHIIDVEKPSSFSDPLKFNIKGYFCNQIKDGQSVIKDKSSSLEGITLGTKKILNCQFDGLDADKTVTCKETVSSLEEVGVLTAFIPGSEEKEEIYLNVLGKESAQPAGNDTFLEEPANGTAGDYTAGGLNVADKPGTKIHINVLEGFSSSSQDFSFNFFGKKYISNNIIMTFILKIFESRLRNRLRLRNLDDIQANCQTDDSKLLEKIPRSKLDESRHTMLICSGQSSTTDGLGIDKNNIPPGAVLDDSIKNDKNIADNLGDNYLNLLSKAISEGLTIIHVVGVEKPSSFDSPLTFKITSYYADQIGTGNSVIRKDQPLTNVELGTEKKLTCEFEGFDTGKKLKCSEKVSSLEELGDFTTIKVPGSDKEQIYLNLGEYIGNGKTSSGDKSSSGLSGGAIAAIVIASVVVVVAIGIIIYMVMRKPVPKPDENEHNRTDSVGNMAQ